jgi:hypothetical protein
MKKNVAPVRLIYRDNSSRKLRTLPKKGIDTLSLNKEGCENTVPMVLLND